MSDLQLIRAAIENNIREVMPLLASRADVDGIAHDGDCWIEDIVKLLGVDPKAAKADAVMAALLAEEEADEEAKKGKQDKKSTCKKKKNTVKAIEKASPAAELTDDGCLRMLPLLSTRPAIRVIWLR